MGKRNREAISFCLDSGWIISWEGSVSVPLGEQFPTADHPPAPHGGEGGAARQE